MKNFKKIICLIIIFSGMALQSNAQIVRPVGTNLAGIEDWSSEYVFVDVFNQSRKWISYEIGSGKPWSSGVNIPLDSNGYPLEIPFNNGVNPPQAIRTLLFFGDNIKGDYPEGNYQLIVLGTGQVRLWGAATGTFICPVDTSVLVNSSAGGIGFEIETSDVSDPIHDIHFIMPGFKNSHSTNPFNPALLDFIDDFQVVRFMDWMKTNNSQVTEWTDRNKPGYYTQTLENGVAYEHIIDICNRTQKNPWICIPHKADDQFISEIAKLFRDSLDQSLKIYVEYSNEVWNGQFAQSSYADSMGNVLGYSGNSWEQGWQYYAKRTADVMQIFETEFQGSDRLVKVISGQAGNSWVTNYIIERFEESKYNPSQVKIDAVAIAPYFGGAVANSIGDVGLIEKVTVSDILDSLQLSLQKSFDWMDAHKIVADKHDANLITYEGGQHLVASPKYYNNAAFVDKLTDANRNSQMEDLYCEYLNYWYENAGAGMFCHFSSHGTYGKYGSWGVKEFMNDTLSPKYLGLKNCVFSYNIPTAINDYKQTQHKAVHIYPVPSGDGIINIEHNLINPGVYLYNSSGQQISFNIESKTDNKLVLKLNDYKGFAVLLLDDGNGGVVLNKVIFQ